MAKAGRKPYIEEMELKGIANLALKTIKSLLMRTDLNVDQQIKLALPLMLKRMPDKIEAEGMAPIFQLIIAEANKVKNNRLTEIENDPRA